MTYQIEENIDKQQENLKLLGLESSNPETLAERIKLYEGVYSDRLMSDMPIIVRIDGKNFSKYTKQFKKPFDSLLVHTMHHCAKKVASELQGFKLAYHQSDEISFLITNGGNENSEVAFGGKINKINSLVASYMAGHFNDYMREFSTVKKLAFFDCRCFNVPENDVTNYFLHRAKDWKRNSITMLGREYFSHKEMHKKNSQTVKNMLSTEKKVFWEMLNDDLKYGTFIYKEDGEFVNKAVEVEYSKINGLIEEVTGLKK